MASNRDHRLHLRRNPGRFHPVDRHDILGRLVQASRRLAHGRCHCQQERMGLRFRRIHHAMDLEERLSATHHDEYVLDHAVVLFRYRVLLFREDVQEMVEE